MKRQYPALSAVHPQSTFVSYILICTALGSFLIFGLIGLRFSDWRLVWTASGAGISLILPFWLIRRGHFRIGNVALMTIVLASVTATATLGQGIRDLVIVAYPIIFICVGLTLDRTILRLCSGFTFAAILWLAFGEAIGLFTVIPISPDPANLYYFSGVTVLLIVAVLAVELLSSNIRRNVEHMAKEIDERKKAEEKLRQNEEKFRSIIEQSVDGIEIVDEHGFVSEWNAAQESVTGLQRSDVVGLPAWEVQYLLLPTDLKTPETLAEVRESLLSILRGTLAPKRRNEHTILRADGNYRTLSSSAFVLKQGERDMFVSFARDITEEKNAEKDRLRLDNYFNQIQRLESLGVLAGGIAHDFNNLLAAIYGNIGLARDKVDNDTVSDILSQAIQSMDRARGLTQQLLTFAKGGAPSREITSMAAIIRETNRFSLSGSHVKSVVNISEDLWHCNVDKNQIGQVIQNMIINAVQAMPMAGTIEITAKNITLKSEQHLNLQKGDYIQISIRDQGMGISKELLPRIFDPFFTTKTQGHGLGLATSYSIIAHHDGAVEVESEPGKGSVFHIFLPACDGSSAETVNTAAAKHTGSGRVLVMDDEEAVYTFLSRMLQSFGYSSICKADAKETIACFVAETSAGRQLSAVILDLTMPGQMGGKEVCEEIRKIDSNLPIFVLSGYANDPIISNPLDYGFTASLSKPFTRDELAGMLEEHLGGKETYT